MAPNEWIARRTVCRSLGTVSTADESTRPSPGVEAPFAGRGTTAPDTVVAAGHLFSARVIDDGAGMIKLDVPHFVTREGRVPVSIEVNWGLVLAKAVACLYVVADGNREPLLACIPLIPGVVPPHVCVSVRLDDSGDVRAIVECGDGTLLQVRRWVWVMPPDVEPS
jgi:predicted secreted protein